MQEDDFHSNVCDFSVPVIIIQVKRAEWLNFSKTCCENEGISETIAVLVYANIVHNDPIWFRCATWSPMSPGMPIGNCRSKPRQVIGHDQKQKKWNKNIMRQHSLTGIPPTRCSCVCWCSMPARKSCLKHINWINYSRQVMKCQDRFPLNLYAQSKPTVIHHDGINNPQIYAVTKTWVKNKGWMFALFLIYSHTFLTTDTTPQTEPKTEMIVVRHFSIFQNHAWVSSKCMKLYWIEAFWKLTSL